jgi:isoleucyl-tRNA synthetase
MNVELSAFYFDIRKDALYCDAPSSLRRKAAFRWCAICSTRWSSGGAAAAVHHRRGLARPSPGCTFAASDPVPGHSGQLARRRADMAEIAITSELDISTDSAPADAFTLREAPGVAVVVRKSADLGLVKCARSWRYTDDIGSDPEFPDVSARDAEALRELKALGRL